MATQYPKLDEVAERLCRDVKHRDKMKELARQVAAGERSTEALPPNAVIFAFQVLFICIDHVDEVRVDRN